MTFQQFMEHEARVSKKHPAAIGATDDGPEFTLHDSIIKECKARGWIYFHGSMAHRTRRTIAEPDFVILANDGRVILCEVKSKNGKLSPEQFAIGYFAKKLGHKIHVVRSFADFLNVIML